jgi:hypothetical protein
VPGTMHRMTWWRDSKGRTRVLLVGFAALALLGVLLPGIYDYLLAGDRRQLVVTLQQGVSDGDRETLKQACGTLPGITVVADQGARERQYRFPVRFRISDSTPAEEAALNACIDRYPQLVRGVLTERDR